MLRAQLLALYDLEESNIFYERILEELDEDPDLEIILLIAENLTRHGNVRLFMRAVKQAVPLLNSEEELQNLLTMIAQYYRCLDRDEEEKMIRELLESRSLLSLDAPVNLSDKAVVQISHLISNHLP